MAGSQEIVLRADMDKKLSIKNKYYKYFPFKFLVERVIRNRTQKIVNSFDKFIERKEKILDIGGGGGWIAEEIQKRKNNEVTLLDVTDFNQTNLKLVLYDGEKIPFSDNSFDLVLLIYVLHHTKNPLKLLEEAERVTKDRIIIFEDTFSSHFDKFFLCFGDILTNFPVLFREKMPFNFKKVSEWEKIFEDFQLKLIFKNKFSHQALFVLKKF